MEAPQNENLFSELEIATALSQCNFNKGIGPDGFDGRIIQKDEEVKAILTKEITAMINCGQVPDHLKIARLVPLTKMKGTSTATIQDVRPIMIKSHIYKVMEKAILNRIKDERSRLLISGNYQNGFKEQRSTCNNLA